MLFLSDINDNAPALHPRSRYVEVGESALRPSFSRLRVPTWSPMPTPLRLNWTIRGKEQETHGSWGEIGVSICIGWG